MAAALYLADSNILLRLVKLDHPEYPLVRQAVETLHRADVRFAYTLQNMAEFWNVSTRPLERNGFGLTTRETEANAKQIERSFTFLPDKEAVYRKWRRLVVAYQVMGVQVHDARLAAAVSAHGLTHILSLNAADFARFQGLVALHPSQILMSSV